MLISCPSCGKRVSDRAPACPFCKAPNAAASGVKSAAPSAPPEAIAAAVPPAPPIMIDEPQPAPLPSVEEPAPASAVDADESEPGAYLTLPYTESAPEETLPEPLPVPEVPLAAAPAVTVDEFAPAVDVDTDDSVPDPSYTLPYTDVDPGKPVSEDPPEESGPYPYLTLPFTDVRPVETMPPTAPPPNPDAPKRPEFAIPFPPTHDPSATLPAFPALFGRHALGAQAPPTPSAPAPAPAAPTTPAPKVEVNAESAAAEAAKHLEAGRFQDALTAIDVLLRTQPRNGDALNARAHALFKLGRRDEAASSIVKAIESSPDSLPFWLNKALMEHEEDKPKDSCRSAMDLVEIAQHTGEESDVLEQGRQMIADFEATGAYPSVRGYLGWLGLGCVSMKAGRPEAALDFFDRAIDTASSKPHGFRWKGKALMQLDQVDEAFVLFDAALEVAPNDPDVHYDRGMAFAILGDIERATEAFDAAIAADPHHTEAIKEKRYLA